MGFWLKSFNKNSPHVPRNHFSTPDMNNIPLVTTGILMAVAAGNDLAYVVQVVAPSLSGRRQIARFVARWKGCIKRQLVEPVVPEGNPSNGDFGQAMTEDGKSMSRTN